MTRFYTTILGAGLLAVPLLYNSGGGTFLPVKRTALFLCLLAYSLAWLRNRGVHATLWLSSASIRLGLLYTGIAALSAFWALNRSSTVAAVSQLAALFLLFVLAVNTLTVDDFPRLSRYVATAVAVVSTLGVIEFFNFDRVILDTIGVAHLRIPSVGRPSSTFGFRNTAASFLIGSLPFALLACFADSNRRNRWMWGIASGLALILLIYTRTRGAWVGLSAAAVLTAAYLIRARVDLFGPLKRNLLWVGTGIVILSALSSLGPRQSLETRQKFDAVKGSTTQALASITDPSADKGRLIFWKHTLRMIADHPLIGVGFDNWEYYYPMYDRGDWIRSTSEPVRPHNDTLWVWSELGPLGLIGFLGMIGWTVLSLFKRPPVTPIEIAVRAACLGSVVAIFVHGGFSFLREHPTAGLLLWVSLAGLTVGSNRQKSRQIPFAGLATVGVALAATAVGFAQIRFTSQYGVAKYWHDRGENQRALTAISDVDRIGSFDHRSIFLKGRILQASGRLDEARTAYRAALDRHPYYANTHHNLAGVEEQLGDARAAQLHFKRALDIRPNYYQARINYANALVRSGQLAAARNHVTQVTTETEVHPEAFALLGAIYLHEGHTTKAVIALEKAVRLNPNFGVAYNNLAVAYERSGNTAGALRAYQMVAQNWTGDPTYLEGVRERIQQLEEELNR